MILGDRERSAARLQVMINHCQAENLMLHGSAHAAGDALSFVRELRPDLLVWYVTSTADIRNIQFMCDRNTIPCHTEILVVSDHQHTEAIGSMLKGNQVSLVLRPVKMETFRTIVHRLAEKVTRKKMRVSLSGKVSLKGMKGPLIADPGNIAWMKADGHYTCLFMKSDHHEVILQNIGAVEELLCRESFVRIDRSTILNLTWVESVVVKKRMCVMRKGEHSFNIRLSKAGLERLMSILKEP